MKGQISLKIEWHRYGFCTLFYFYFTTSKPTSIMEVLEFISKVLHELNVTFDMPFTTKEVKCALFDIEPLKSHGPNVTMFLLEVLTYSGRSSQ